MAREISYSPQALPLMQAGLPEGSLEQTPVPFFMFDWVCHDAGSNCVFSSTSLRRLAAGGQAARRRCSTQGLPQDEIASLAVYLYLIGRESSTSMADWRGFSQGLCSPIIQAGLGMAWSRRVHNKLRREA